MTTPPYMPMTYDERVNDALTWLCDYRMMPTAEQEEGLFEGLLFGAALAIRHPEYLQALVQAACASEDRDLEDLPDGHAGGEKCSVVDLLVEQLPWGEPR